MIRTTIIIAVGLTLAALLPAAPAHALRARVFVSKTGSDVGTCSFSAPCQSLDFALIGVEPGGEITILDSGGYNPITITKGVTITVPPGVEAGIAAPAGNPAIIVNTFGASTVVALHGLVLDGQGTATDGVLVQGTGRIEIYDCVIRNFTHDGINFFLGQFGGTNPNTVLVSNTITVDNGSAGIEVKPNNPFLARGVFTNVKTAGNGGAGILIDGTQTGTGAFVDVQLSDIVSDSNGGDGITVLGTGDVKVDIRNSVSSNNGGNGLSVSNARVSISNNSLVLNTNSGFSNSGTLFSFLDNVIENNRLLNVGTTTTEAKQ